MSEIEFTDVDREAAKALMYRKWYGLSDAAYEAMFVEAFASHRIAAQAESKELDRWACGMQAVLSDLSHIVTLQTEHGTRPVRPIVLGAELCKRICESVKLPQSLGGDSDDPPVARLAAAADVEARVAEAVRAERAKWIAACSRVSADSAREESDETFHEGRMTACAAVVQLATTEATS